MIRASINGKYWHSFCNCSNYGIVRSTLYRYCYCNYDMREVTLFSVSHTYLVAASYLDVYTRCPKNSKLLPYISITKKFTIDWIPYMFRASLELWCV